MQSTLIYEKDNAGCEYWKESSTGKVFKFRNGKRQKFYDSRGNLVSVINGTDSARLKYNDKNRIVFECYIFSCPNSKKKEEYKKWYSYDENGIIISIIDSYGNMEFYDDQGNHFYSINRRPIEFDLAAILVNMLL